MRSKTLQLETPKNNISLSGRLSLAEATYQMIYSHCILMEKCEGWELRKAQVTWKREIVDFLKTVDLPSKRYILEILKKEDTKIYLLVLDMVNELQQELNNMELPTNEPVDIVSKIISYFKNLFNEEKSDEEICVNS